MNKSKDGAMNPYLAGGLSGLVIVFSALLTGNYFGASTSFVRSAGMLENFVTPGRAAQVEYFIRYMPKLDWQLMFVVGIFLGSLVAALTTGSFKWQAVPDMWATRFGANPVKRGIAAFLAGIIAMFGARLANGCPSGHGLSGAVQLAISGFIALTCFFVGGIVVARLLYRGGKK